MNRISNVILRLQRWYVSLIVQFELIKDSPLVLIELNDIFTRWIELRIIHECSENIHLFVNTHGPVFEDHISG